MVRVISPVAVKISVPNTRGRPARENLPWDLFLVDKEFLCIGAPTQSFVPVYLRRRRKRTFHRSLRKVGFLSDLVYKKGRRFVRKGKMSERESFSGNVRRSGFFRCGNAFEKSGI